MNDEWKAKGKGKGEKIKPGDTADGVKVRTRHHTQAVVWKVT